MRESLYGDAVLAVTPDFGVLSIIGVIECNMCGLFVKVAAHF